MTHSSVIHTLKIFFSCMKSLRRSFSWESIALLLNNAVGEAISVSVLYVDTCLSQEHFNKRKHIRPLLLK